MKTGQAMTPAPPPTPERCPTCDSPAPHLHPAVQSEGEVQPCRDAFHLRNTPENRLPPASPTALSRVLTDAVIGRLYAILLDIGEHGDPTGNRVRDYLVDVLSPALDALAREDEQEWRDMVTGATLAAQATEAELAEAQALVLDGEATVAALRLRLTEAEQRQYSAYAAFVDLFWSIAERHDPLRLERLLVVPESAYADAQEAQQALASRPVPPAHDRQEPHKGDPNA